MAKAVKVSEEKKVSKRVESTNSDEYITLSLKGLSLPWAILLGVIIFTAGISSALYFGLKSQSAATPNLPGDSVPTFAASEFSEVSLAFKDGPRKGSENAKVVIVEFSDLACPYCQKFHMETYPTLVSEYIEKGNVALVYKHYPLAFHNPAATEAAKASYCVETLYSDEKMFAFIDQFFVNLGTVTQNASGTVNLVDKEFTGLFTKVGVDANRIKNCMKTAEATDRVERDIAELTEFQNDIVAKGLSQGLGTPSFVIGTIKNGRLEGRLIEGAYPLVAFQNVIEEQLNKK